MQNVLRQIATFLTGDEVKNAKEILEDLGIIFGTPGLGLFGYLKWKNNRAVAEIRDTDALGIVIVQLGDGNTATVSKNAINLSKNVKVRNAVEGTLKPLGIDGIDTIKFTDTVSSEIYNKEDATTIIASFDIPRDVEVEAEQPEIDPVMAFLRVHTSAFDEKSTKWRFIYEGRPILVDISETSIAADTVRRGIVQIDDLYKVRMTITSHITPTGLEHFEYKIIEVIAFTPAKPQYNLPI